MGVKTRQIRVAMSPEEKRFYEQHARARGLSMASLLKTTLRSYLVDPEPLKMLLTFTGKHATSQQFTLHEGDANAIRKEADRLGIRQNSLIRLLMQRAAHSEYVVYPVQVQEK